MQSNGITKESVTIGNLNCREGVYYLRLLGYATEGDVGAHKATIKFLVPLLGKHYYPHGVEYGEGEYFPVSLVKECEKILADVKERIR